MMGAASVAGATDHGFYANVDAGAARFPQDVQLTVVPDGAPFTLNDPRYKRESSRATDFAWSFAAGYRFNRYLAAELGFSDLGHARSNLITTADPDTNPRKGDIEFSARGKSLALLAHMPAGNWDSYVKLGAIQTVYAWEARAFLTPTNEQQRTGRTEETRALVGLGTRYAFTERWAMSFALDCYLNVGDGNDRANIISPRIGFAYRF
jgi:hypothetical protein